MDKKINKAIPEYDHDDSTHWFIWHLMADELKEEDFEAIQMALIEREDTHKAINESNVEYVKFDDEKYQPRTVPDWMKEKAHKYADWSCAFDICMILSKYAKFYSNSKYPYGAK